MLGGGRKPVQDAYLRVAAFDREGGSPEPQDRAWARGLFPPSPDLSVLLLEASFESARD